MLAADGPVEGLVRADEDCDIGSAVTTSVVVDQDALIGVEVVAYFEPDADRARVALTIRQRLTLGASLETWPNTRPVMREPSGRRMFWPVRPITRSSVAHARALTAERPLAEQMTVRDSMCESATMTGGLHRPVEPA